MKIFSHPTAMAVLFLETITLPMMLYLQLHKFFEWGDLAFILFMLSVQVVAAIGLGWYFGRVQGRILRLIGICLLAILPLNYISALPVSYVKGARAAKANAEMTLSLEQAIEAWISARGAKLEVWGFEGLQVSWLYSQGAVRYLAVCQDLIPERIQTDTQAIPIDLLEQEVGRRYNRTLKAAIIKYDDGLKGRGDYAVLKAGNTVFAIVEPLGPGMKDYWKISLQDKSYKYESFQLKGQQVIWK